MIFADDYLDLTKCYRKGGKSYETQKAATQSAEGQHMWSASLGTQGAATTSAEAQRLSSASPETQGIQKLNDCVYRVHPPNSAEVVVPSVEIVFLHGVTRLEQNEAYIETWKTPDGSVLWPKVWLPLLFSRAVIYLVSYDSSAWTDSTHGRSDLFQAGETVLHNLLLAKIGQTCRCPLILVGHDIGGLVIEQVCVLAQMQTEKLAGSKEANLFLKQLKGIFCLATPYAGMPLNTSSESEHSQIYKRRKVFDEKTCRLTERFQILKQKNSWKTFNVHPTHGSKDGQLNYSPEASGRLGSDQFLPLATDAENITKPRDKNSGCFPPLEDFIRKILIETHGCPTTSFSSDSKYVPIVETVEKVQNLLLTEKVVVLYGEPGIGKSSLVNYIALQYQKERKHHSVFRHGCYLVECERGGSVERVQLRLLSQLLGVDNASKYQKLNDPALFRLKLRECLEHLDVLIIVDNVRDYDLLDGLRVEGEKVKYLLTAEEPGPWIRGKEVCLCRMDGISFHYGKQILAKKAGFANVVIPDHLQMVVTDILEITGCNPFALATLALAIREEQRANGVEWLDILQNLPNYLQKVDQGHGMSSSRKKYPRGVYASTAYAVKQGRLCSQLKALDVRTIIKIHDRDGSVDSVSIYPLRQHFLLSTSEEPVKSIREKVKQCLANRATYDSPCESGRLPDNCLVRVLFALYGAEETQEFAKDTLRWPCVLHPRLFEALRECLLPFLHLYRESSEPLQWFTELILQGTLHAYSVLKLFEESRYASFISRVLVDLFLAMSSEDGERLYLATFEYAYYSLLNLIAVHSKADEALTMLRAFIGSITFSSGLLRKVAVHTLPAGVVDSDFDAFVALDESAWDAVVSHSKDVGFFADNLRVANTVSGLHIKEIPGTWETLVGKFSKNEEREVQFQSLALFAFMVIVSRRPHSFIESIPGALDALFSVLRESDPEQASSSSRSSVSSLVILLEFLAMLVLRQAFDSGLGLSPCLNTFWLSENCGVLETLVRRALDWERDSLGMSPAFEIIAHLLHHDHMRGSRLTNASRKCLLPLREYAFHWEHTSLVKGAGEVSFSPGEVAGMTKPSLTTDRREQLLEYITKSASDKFSDFITWKYLEAMVARNLILAEVPRYRSKTGRLREIPLYPDLLGRENMLAFIMAKEEGDKRRHLCALEVIRFGERGILEDNLFETKKLSNTWKVMARGWDEEHNAVRIFMSLMPGRMIRPGRVLEWTAKKQGWVLQQVVHRKFSLELRPVQRDTLPWIKRTEDFEALALWQHERLALLDALCFSGFQFVYQKYSGDNRIF